MNAFHPLRSLFVLALLTALSYSCSPGVSRPKLKSRDNYAYLELAQLRMDADETDMAATLSLLLQSDGQWRYEFLSLGNRTVRVFHNGMKSSDHFPDGLLDRIHKQFPRIERMYMATRTAEFHGIVEYLGSRSWRFRSADGVDLLFDKESGRIVMVCDGERTFHYLPLEIPSEERNRAFTNSSSILARLVNHSEHGLLIADWTNRIMGSSIIKIPPVEDAEKAVCN